MKARLLLFRAGMMFVLLAHFLFQAQGLQAQSPQTVTTTLLPLDEAGDKVENALWVENSKPKPKEVVLQFDLSALPAGLKDSDFKMCFLRLVASNVVYQPDPKRGGGSVVVVTVRKEGGHATNIAALTFSESATAVSQDDPALRKAIWQQYRDKPGERISLRLSTNSDKASSLFYSSKAFGGSPSNIPRLVIEYTPPPPSLMEAMSWPQHQQNPEHTGGNSWKPFRGPDGFEGGRIELPKIDNQVGKVVDYPLIYQGKLYLLENVSEANYLVALDFQGKPVFEKAILIDAVNVQGHPAISGKGILYVVTSNKIIAYDLRQEGKKVAIYPENENLTGKLSDYTDLTVGNDGSVFLALDENNVNYIYGFTSDLRPMLKSGALPKGNVSTVTVSPDGTEIFAETKCPESFKSATGCMAEIRIANPWQTTFTALKSEISEEQPQDYYNTPVGGATEGDGSIMVMSDIAKDAHSGNVWALKASTGGGFEGIWNASSSKSLVSRPALGSNRTVYYIQDSRLQGHKLAQVGKADSGISDKNTGLKTSSNLVMDGGDNIYFWDNGTLRGYKPDGSALFTTTKVLSTEVAPPPKLPDGPEQFIRLMLGPDGTLWANNNNAAFLWLFKPQYTQTNLTLNPADLQPTNVPMVYRTNGNLKVADSVTLKAGTNTLFQAQTSIAFGKGFTVEKGASLLCRTGF